MKNVRIGNLELRTTEDFHRRKYQEIVRWYPNSYYGSEKRLKEEGWTFDSDGSAHKGNLHVCASCFLDTESCFTVATVEWSANDEYDVRSVGRRAFNLTEKDFESFKSILDEIDKSILDETTAND